MLHDLQEYARNANLFDMFNRNLKAFTSFNNFKSATFTTSSVKKLMHLEGTRIFHSKGNFQEKPKLCVYNSIGMITGITAVQVQRNKELLTKKRHYIGNWVISINKEKPGDFLTTLGFILCKKDDPEFLVRHMNLCKYCHVRFEAQYNFYCSGMFVVGVDDEEDQSPIILINMDSGTWYMFKLWLKRYFEEEYLNSLDKRIIGFARPRVKALLRNVLRMQQFK